MGSVLSERSAKYGSLELLVYIQRDRQAYPLPPRGEVRIGRSAANDIRIDHRSVSRSHLRMTIGEVVEIEDVGSANGTFLQSKEESPARLEETARRIMDRQLPPGERAIVRAGEMIRIGAVLVMLHQARHTSVHDALRGDRDKPGKFVVEDPQVKRIHELAARAAASDITVLILGETGVGKEVLAEIVHVNSRRAHMPLLRLNCAALSETLLESELFGYERGAFTGAVGTKPGLLESTNGGTVFLDEIGEMPLTTQVKLLRVIEERAVRRVGGTKSRSIDVRYVTATNRELEKEIAKGRFREDLFFRINGVKLTVPPLRVRQSEIEPLARHFLRAFCETTGISEPELTPDALQAMHSYRWPGNVRELRNVMERAPFLVGEGPIRAEHIPQDPSADTGDLMDDEDSGDHTQVYDKFAAPTEVQPVLQERQRIVKALESCGGNQSRAAKMLGISRRTLVNRLDEYDLPRPRKRQKSYPDDD